VAMIATTQGTRVLVMTTTSYTALYAASCANSTPEHAPPPGAPGAVNGAVHRGARPSLQSLLWPCTNASMSYPFSQPHAWHLVYSF
jgi:hypothetical protein